jgi:hypothetical protein
MGTCVDVRFDGHQHARGRVGVLTENRLTSDNDDVWVVSDVGRRPDDVLQFLTSHGAARCSSPTVATM